MPGKAHVPDLVERLIRGQRAGTPRTAGGFARGASPQMVRDRIGASLKGGGVGNTVQRSSKIDKFEIVDDADSSFTLTYTPLFDTWNVSLGWPLEDGTDYGIVGKTLTVVDPTALFRGIAANGPRALQVQYDYLTGVPTTPTGAYVEEVMADGPWLYWRGLGSTYPTMPDESGNNRDGTWDSGLYATHGRPTIVPTVADGQAWDGYLGPSAGQAERPAYTAADRSDLAGTSLTVELWCDPTVIPPPGENHTGGLWEMAADTFVRISNFGAPNDQLQFEFRGTAITANVMTAGASQHIVATYNASSGAMKLYRNNTLVASGTAATGGLTSTPSAFKANSNFNGNRHFDGDMQEVAVYLTDLSAARIDAHYTAGIGA